MCLQPPYQTAKEKLLFDHSGPLPPLFQGDSESTSNFPGTFFFTLIWGKCMESQLRRKEGPEGEEESPRN